MSCDDYRELLRAYLDDSLDEVRRTGFRAHLRSCPECRELAVAEEPTLMFSLAGGREPSRDRIEACVTAVVAGVRQDRLQQRLRHSRRRWLAAAAAVVLAVIVGAAWWINAGGSGETPTLQADAHESAAADPVAEAPAPSVVEPPPRVEVDMQQEEVRVYQYAIGDDASTGAVFIVNPAMEL
jgi:anti-sigma factor RsiW